MARVLLCWVGRSSTLWSSGDESSTTVVSGFIGRMMLANADVLCALATPLIPAQYASS